jgi:hypothetical protein
VWPFERKSDLWESTIVSARATRMTIDLWQQAILRNGPSAFDQIEFKERWKKISITEFCDVLEGPSQARRRDVIIRHYQCIVRV